MLMPVLMLPANLYLYSTRRRNRTICVVLICLALAVLAFHFRPLSSQNTDILRHWRQMTEAGKMTFAKAADSDAFSSLMSYFTLLKVFSYAESKYLLPAFVTFIGYFMCLYVISKLDHNARSEIRFLTIFTFLACISFLGFCSGIRQYLCFAIFLLTFYTEVVKGKLKKGAWVIYVLLTTIHTSAGFLIVLRLVCAFFSRVRKINYFAVFLVFWSFIQEQVVSFLATNFSGNHFIDKVVELSGFYEENPSAFIIPSYLWRFVFMIFCTVMVFFLIKNHKEEDRIPKKYLQMVLCICMFTFGGFTSYDLFARFSTFSLMFGIPLIPYLFEKVHRKSRQLCYYGLLACSILVFLYQLSGYLDFHYSSMYQIVFTNIFTLIGGI